MTLRRQATRGVFWVGVSTTINGFFLQLNRLILARMLLPGDFGLVAMANLSLDFLARFREMGFSSALIYHKGDMRKAADTTFIMLLVIAALLTVISFAFAPVVALFFRTAELTNVLRALSVTFILSALGEVHLSLLAKNMSFRERLLPDLVPTAVNGIIAVLLALMGFGAWSLVIAKIVDTALTSMLAWVVVPWWRPRLRFDRQEARGLFDYGKHIIGSSVLIYFITNLDSTFVGRVLGEAQLAFYNFAYNQANLPATQISRVVGQVLFPAYSLIQENIETLRSAFFKSLRYVCLLSIPLSVGMIAFAAPFMYTLYGARWAPAIVPLQVLGLYGLLRSVAVNMGSVFKAGGKPNWLTYIALGRLAVMGIFLYPATRYYGIIGVSVLSAVVSIVDLVVSAALTNLIIHGKLADYVSALWVPSVFSVLSAVVATRVYGLISAAHGFIGLVMAGILMVFLYLTAVLVFDREVRALLLGWLSAAEGVGQRWISGEPQE